MKVILHQKQEKVDKIQVNNQIGWLIRTLHNIKLVQWQLNNTAHQVSQYKWFAYE